MFTVFLSPLHGEDLKTRLVSILNGKKGWYVNGLYFKWDLIIKIPSIRIRIMTDDGHFVKKTFALNQKIRILNSPGFERFGG